MNKTRITAALSTMVALAVTACGGSASQAAHAAAATAAAPANSRSSATATAPANSTSSGATCAQASGIIQMVVNAQAAYDASGQTDYIDYLFSLDAATAVIDAGGPIDAKPKWSPAGSGRLNHDLYQFSTDASQFTQGGQSTQSAVSSDINALAADCRVSPTSSGSASPAAGSLPASSNPSAPTMTKQTDTVVFRVRGSGYPSIQYGTDSDNNQATGGHGPLGDGNALPWTASMTYNPNALYYVVSAQLEGSGNITDTVTEVITTYCSDGTHKTESFPLASGHASGGYAIASAQYNSTGSGTGNALQAESDAGC